jgi:hypothetical protein
VGLTLAERKAVTRKIAARYQKAPKSQKSRMLDELCALCDWNRDHARRALREALEPPKPRRRPVRTPLYGAQVLEALRVIWATLDGPAGKRLAPVIAETLEALERHGEIAVSEEVRDKLIKISPATIDRLLVADRRALRLKGRSRTRPGTLLKHQIPIRTFADWDERTPGFMQADLVAHDGGDPRGQCCQTLTVTDVFTGWTETRALPVKAQRWVVGALEDIEQALPFALSGLDTDNGGEFINHTLAAYCAERAITFTRGRSYRKNDSCFVEQKNDVVVRRVVGYARYDTPEELQVLTQLYEHLRLYVNFFQPQMHLLRKTRVGARVTKRYDRAQTPYRRLLASGALEPEEARLLTKRFEALNPAALKRELAACQERLIQLARCPKAPPKGHGAGHPWRGDRGD